MKIFFFIVLITTILFSKEVQFKETKYLYALNNEFSKIGTLNIDDNKILLHYNHSDKNIVYTSENIQIITKDSK